MSFPAFTALQAGYARLWTDLVPRPEHESALKEICAALIARKAAYEAVSQAVWGKPDSWFIVALIDQMEHDPARGLCNSHLHNGDSLAHRTVDVPAGRPPPPAEPPFTFLASAMDALHYDGFDQVASWTPERLAYWLERYNGEGYLDKPIANPYLAAWSNLYTAGKYTSDHHYDPEAVSQQPGALTLLKILIDLDPTIAGTLGLAPAPAQPKEPDMPTTTPAAPAAPSVAATVVQDIELALTAAQTIFPLIPPLAPFLPAEQALLAAVHLVAQATGLEPAAALQAVISHLTPGQPNAAALS
jgi:lysozyme family protein